MADEKNKESLWIRLRRKYRLSILHEETLAEAWHVRLSWLGAFTVLFLMFVLTLCLFSLAIIYTPIKSVLPGYSENIRQQLLSETARVDSLETTLQLQQQYLGVVKQVMVGEIQPDTLQALDTAKEYMREQLLIAKQEATEELVAEYEAKEKDQFQLFDVQTARPELSLFRPVHGVVMQHFSAEKRQYGVQLRTPANESVSSVLAGTVIAVDMQPDNTYTMVIHHGGYVSIYRHIAHAMRRQGDKVESGECIGIADQGKLFELELWQDGKPINPETLIVF